MLLLPMMSLSKLPVSLVPLPLLLPPLTLAMVVPLQTKLPRLLPLLLGFWHLSCLLSPRLVLTTLTTSTISSRAARRLQAPQHCAKFASNSFYFIYFIDC